MGKIYCEPQMFLGYIDNNWDQSLRVVLYLVGLLWCFVGISIIADIFMGSIEVITSKEKVVQMPDGSRVTVKIWNATVANLTLMALGSSAPEILLSVIEILQGSFFFRRPGPFHNCWVSCLQSDVYLCGLCGGDSQGRGPNHSSNRSVLHHFGVFVVCVHLVADHSDWLDAKPCDGGGGSFDPGVLPNSGDFVLLGGRRPPGQEARGGKDWP
mmetsp:Transcript_13605/g.17738  ORF Transcript_13605/g.17738 Transcript_13605/m.17738 type:complete len:212 (-) Transcript_13605:129-764(-)